MTTTASRRDETGARARAMAWARLPVLLLVALLEPAETAPTPIAGDPRVQAVPYSPDQVVTLRAAMGFATVIELAEDDRVENIVVGNSGAWQLTANQRGNHVIVKPLAEAGPTDAIITTNTRRYVLVLQTQSSSENVPFVVRFDYPRSAAETAAVSAAPSAVYHLRGDRQIYPLSMYDDGRQTVLTWAGNSAVPALFSVDRIGNEALVNGRMTGDDYVVQGVAPRYVLRLGTLRAVASRRPLRAAAR